MGDLPRHQELKCIYGSLIVGKVDQAFVDDFGAGFGSDVAATVHVQFSRNLKIIRCPGIRHRVKEANAAAPGDGVRGSACAASQSDFSTLRCIRASVPTTPRWLNSSVPMSINESFRSGSSELRP
jgi:hypothetical protein